MAKDQLEGLIGTILNDTYEILETIGKGGMAVIFKARHRRLGSYFAVKVFLPDMAIQPTALERFEREAKTTSQLKHPHIIQVSDFNQTKAGLHYIVMELLEGEDLNLRLKRDSMELALVTAIIEQVTSAVEAAHVAGVIHRDLKPSNIFLCRGTGEDPFTKVLDFGISKIQGGMSDLSSVGNLIPGTPGYFPPEIIKGQPATERSDVYSLGVCLYEMLTGRSPFVGNDIENVMCRILTEEPPLPSSLENWIPRQAEEVVMRAIAKNPNKRFASMKEFGKAFTRAMGLLEQTTVFSKPRDTTLGIGVLQAASIQSSLTEEGTSEDRTPTLSPSRRGSNRTDTIFFNDLISPHRRPVRIFGIAAAVLIIAFLSIALLSKVMTGQQVPLTPDPVRVVIVKTDGVKVVKAEDLGSDSLVQTDSVGIEADGKAAAKKPQPDSRVPADSLVKVKTVIKKPAKPLRKRPKGQRPVQESWPTAVTPVRKGFGSLRVAVLAGGEGVLGARVFLDGKPVGVTPLMLNKVSVGAHQVKVQYRSQVKTQRVEVRPRKTVTAILKL